MTKKKRKKRRSSPQQRHGLRHLAKLVDVERAEVAAPVRRTTPFETMARKGEIDDFEFWCGQRFAAGWEAAHGAAAGIKAVSIEMMGGPTGKIPIAPQEIASYAAAAAAEYHELVLEMDRRDHEQHRVGVISRVMHAVCCMGYGLAAVDGVAARRKGWARGMLDEGLRVLKARWRREYDRDQHGG